MRNTAVIDCSIDAVISGLQENIRHLTAEGEEKQMALEDAKAEVKELREFMETVSINSLIDMDCNSSVACLFSRPSTVNNHVVSLFPVGVLNKLRVGRRGVVMVAMSGF